MMPRARAASVPGRIDSHQSLRAAVLLRKGSIVTMRAPFFRAWCMRVQRWTFVTLVLEPQFDEVACVDHRFRVEGGAGAEGDVAAGRPGGGTDRPGQERGAEAVEEPAVEAAALELAHGPGVVNIQW